MCAIFGFIAQRNRGPRLETLEAIAETNECRGPHAFGFAWIDSRGILRQYKQTGRLTDHLPLLAMLQDARMLIGHLRYATHGSPQDQINNHPHPVDGGWLVHNGVVHNGEELIMDHDLMQVSECDSEVIGLLMEDGRGQLSTRAKSAVNKTRGPLAMLALWNRPETMIAARRGNPLHIASTSDGVYLATIGQALPGSCRALADNSLVELSINRGKIESEIHTLRATRSASLFSQSGPYRGG